MVSVPGSHLARALWIGLPRLLVSINAFKVFRLAAVLPEQNDGKTANGQH